MSYLEYQVVPLEEPGEGEIYQAGPVERYTAGWKSWDDDDGLDAALDIMSAISQLDEGEALVIYRIVS